METVLLHHSWKLVESATYVLRACYRHQQNFLVLYGTELRTKWWIVLCSTGYSLVPAVEWVGTGLLTSEDLRLWGSPCQP